MNSTFKQSLAQAREIEKAVGEWIKAQGFAIMPAFDYSGLADDKPPRLSLAGEDLVTPDLLVFRFMLSRWIEVKWKAGADWTRKTQRYETGISLRLWNHYQRVQVLSGLPVEILFIHEREREMRGGFIDEIVQGSRIYDGGKMGRDGMIFFPWAELRLKATYDEILSYLPDDSTSNAQTD